MVISSATFFPYVGVYVRMFNIRVSLHGLYTYAGSTCIPVPYRLHVNIRIGKNAALEVSLKKYLSLFLQLDSFYPQSPFCFKSKVLLMVMMLVNWWFKARWTKRCVDTLSSISQEWRWQIVWNTAWPTVFACPFKYVATHPNASCVLPINIWIHTRCANLKVVRATTFAIKTR